jgi:hypothetical protein
MNPNSARNICKFGQMWLSMNFFESQGFNQNNAINLG